MADVINKVRNPLEVCTLGSYSVTTDFKKLPVDFPDERTVFVVNAEADANLTIGAGDGYAATTDEVLAIPTGYSAFYIDSARFKLSSGADRGNIKVKADKAVTLYVVAVGTAATQEEPVYV